VPKSATHDFGHLRGADPGPARFRVARASVSRGPLIAPYLIVMSLPKTILVPTDFGEASDCAVEYALELAKALGSEIVLMHAFEIPAIGFPDGALVATAEMTNRVLEGAQVGLDRQAAQYEGRGIEMRTVIKQGDAWRSIIATAEELGADLIVMGTHGRRGLPRALLGSVAEKVVRTAHCPVLTVHKADVARDSLRDVADGGERTARSTTTDAVPASRH
jgi:nucleotide-binding universal stress UspA family protein